MSRNTTSNQFTTDQNNNKTYSDLYEENSEVEEEEEEEEGDASYTGKLNNTTGSNSNSDYEDEATPRDPQYSKVINVHDLNDDQRERQVVSKHEHEFTDANEYQKDLGEVIVVENEEKDHVLEDFQGLFYKADQFDKKDLIDLAKVSKEILNLGNNAAAKFNKSYYTAKIKQIKPKVQLRSVPWIFSSRRKPSDLLIKETHNLLKNKVYNLNLEEYHIELLRQDLIDIAKRKNKKTTLLDKHAVTLTEGLELPDHFIILKQIDLPDFSGEEAFIAYNIMFRKLVIMQGPLMTRFTDFSDYKRISRLWKTISNHPNITNLLYIELINGRPFKTIEHYPHSTLEELVEKKRLFYPKKYFWNLTLLLKIIFSICDAMDYSHSQGVLHTNLKPSNILWSKQDQEIGKILEIFNPLHNEGITLTHFGNPAIFDIKNQSYSTVNSGSDMNFIKRFWPNNVGDLFFWLKDNTSSSKFDKQHNLFLEELVPNLDIYSFGLVLIYLVSGKIGWDESSQIGINDIRDMTKRENHYFHASTYDKIEALVFKCIVIYDQKNFGNAFMSFKEIKATLLNQFNYFIKIVEHVHPLQRQESLLPKIGSNYNNFRAYYMNFCQNFYYDRYQDAIKNLMRADKLSKRLKSDHSLWVKSFEYNKMMIRWLLGEISLKESTQKACSLYNCFLWGDQTSLKHIQTTLASLPYINDSKYPLFYDEALQKMMDRFAFNDNAKKQVIQVNDSKSGIFEIFVSIKRGIIVTACIDEGISCFDLQTCTLIDKFEYPGITAASMEKEGKSVLIGLNNGEVALVTLKFEIERQDSIDKINLLNNQKKGDDQHKKSIKFCEIDDLHRLFEHSTFVRKVEICLSGEKGMSFGSIDTFLVLYDIQRRLVISKSKLENILSSYSFDFNAEISLLSLENSRKITLWKHKAPLNRQKTYLEGHNQFVHIVKISQDGTAALSCCLAMKIVFWNLVKGEGIRSIQIDEHVHSISTTPYFKYIFIKGTKSVRVYEASLDLFWNQYPAEAMSSGTALALSDSIYEYIEENDLMKTKQLLDSEEELGEDKAIELDEFKELIPNKRSLKLIKNALSNIFQVQNESLKTQKYPSLRIVRILEKMKHRRKMSKQFYAKYNKNNPFHLYYIYSRGRKGQRVYKRILNVDPFINFSLDMRCEHEDSFLFSNAQHEMDKMNFQIKNNTFDNSSRYQCFMLDSSLYRDYFQQFDFRTIEKPNLFYTVKKIDIQNYCKNSESDEILYNDFQESGNITMKLNDDKIHFLKFTEDDNHIMVVTDKQRAVIYQVPNYRLKINLDIYISFENRILIQKLLENYSKSDSIDGENILVGASAITAVAVANDLSIVSVALANGLIQIYDTQKEKMVNVVHGHVDFISELELTSDNILVSGGADSNIKIWRINKNNVTELQQVFLKHSDSITSIQILPKMVTENEIGVSSQQDQHIFSIDKEGQGILWRIGSDSVDAIINIGEDTFTSVLSKKIIVSLEFKRRLVKLSKFMRQSSSFQRTSNNIDYIQLEDFKEQARLGKVESDYFYKQSNFLFN